MPRKESEAKRRPMKRRSFRGLETRSIKMDGVTYHLLRGDGRLERLCPHGIGHTVGMMFPTPAELAESSLWIHGCDGCCADYVRMKPENYPKRGRTGKLL